MVKTKEQQIEEILGSLKDTINTECKKHNFFDQAEELKQLSDEEVEAKLKEVFRHVYLYNGDAELISNCNAEYNFGEDSTLAANGMMNLSVHLANRDKRAGILGDAANFSYTTAMRGAAYVIVSDTPSANGVILYANINTVRDYYSEIKYALSCIKMYEGQIQDYIKKNGIFPVSHEALAKGYV